MAAATAREILDPVSLADRYRQNAASPGRAKRTPVTRYRLLTIDLDDTLWPCAPVIRAAEEALFGWLTQAAPRLAARHTLESLREHRRALMAARPELAHDLSRVRRTALAELLADFDYPAHLADEGVALFCEHRNRVEPYADVVPALAALAGRYRLVAVTNGNADVARSPLRGLFHHSVTAAMAGAAKPDPAMFHLALAWAGVPAEQGLHVGDDPYLDVAAARSCGLAAVWVNRAGRPWPDDLAPPQRVVRDLAELERWLTETDHAL